jgi:hypothetical protein
VLAQAGQISEAQIDLADIVLLSEFDSFFSGHSEGSLSPDEVARIAHFEAGSKLLMPEVS